MAWCGIIGHKCQLFALFVAYIEPPESLSPVWPGWFSVLWNGTFAVLA